MREDYSHTTLHEQYRVKLKDLFLECDHLVKRLNMMLVIIFPTIRGLYIIVHILIAMSTKRFYKINRDEQTYQFGTEQISHPVYFHSFRCYDAESE